MQKSQQLQQNSINTLARIALDHDVALDYLLLAEQERISMIINTSCCAYVNNSGKKLKPNNIIPLNAE